MTDHPDIYAEFVPIEFGLAPFRSDRHFQVWKYHVSKKRLLLRSPATPKFKSVIDVHFGGVGLMVLHDSYAGLEIREGNSDEISEIKDRYGANFSKGARLNIFGAGLTSFVISGIMQWHENIDPHSELDVFRLG